MTIPTFQEMWSKYLFNNKSPKIGDDLKDYMCFLACSNISC